MAASGPPFFDLMRTTPSVATSAVLILRRTSSAKFLLSSPFLSTAAHKIQRETHNISRTNC